MLPPCRQLGLLLSLFHLQAFAVPSSVLNTLTLRPSGGHVTNLGFAMWMWEEFSYHWGPKLGQYELVAASASSQHMER